MATMISRTVLTHTPERARRATIRIETDNSVYVGRIWVSDAKQRVSDVLAEDRQFLSLTEVKVNGGDQVEAYMAVNKSFIRTLRFLDEGTPAEAAPRPRAHPC